MQVRVGNTVKFVNERFRWKLYVQPVQQASNNIASVTFRLHSSFTNPVITVKEPPFEVERVGWGTFDVDIVVQDTNGVQHSLVHSLSFDPSKANAHVETLAAPFVLPVADPAPPVAEAATQNDSASAAGGPSQKPLPTAQNASPTARAMQTRAAAASAAAASADSMVDVPDGLDELSVTELRAHLAARGLSTAGDKAALLQELRNAAEPKRLAESEKSMHGFLGVGKGWKAPVLVVECAEDARPGYNTMKAHEYVDDPVTLHAKVAQLALLLTQAKNCVAYTGAGISTASGIADYASKASASVAVGAPAARPKLKSSLDAEPTLGHRVLVALQRAGYLHHWVQQNHDGLPQKAGCPQHVLNEIHGSWFDPSNPVVPMTGTLRGDLIKTLVEWEQRADLTLAMGTSLCGMNADRLVTSVARRSPRRALGAVIVSLQQTQYDDISALRIFAKIDVVMSLLAAHMALRVDDPDTVYVPRLPAHSADGARVGVYRVPYDSRTGERTHDGSTSLWDLRDGAGIRLMIGPGENFTGTIMARSPSPRAAAAAQEAKRAPAGDRAGEPHALSRLSVRLPMIREGHPQHGSLAHIVNYAFGNWWIEAATKGECDRLPFVNTKRLRA